MPLPPRAPEPVLNPELERLMYQLKVVRQDAQGMVFGLTDSQLQWSPGQGAWSVKSCFEHLNETNKKMIGALETSVRSGRQANQLHDGPYTYGFFARWFFRNLEPPVKRRFSAPAAVQPQGNKSWQQVQEEWESSHERLAQLLREANGLDLARIRTQSPISSWVRYSLGMAFWIQSAHDRRHLWQARNVITHANFPKVAAAPPATPQTQSA